MQCSTGRVKILGYIFGRLRKGKAHLQLLHELHKAPERFCFIAHDVQDHSRQVRHALHTGHEAFLSHVSTL